METANAILLDAGFELANLEGDWYDTGDIIYQKILEIGFLHVVLKDPDRSGGQTCYYYPYDESWEDWEMMSADHYVPLYVGGSIAQAVKKAINFKNPYKRYSVSIDVEFLAATQKEANDIFNDISKEFEDEGIYLPGRIHEFACSVNLPKAKK